MRQSDLIIIIIITINERRDYLCLRGCWPVDDLVLENVIGRPDSPDQEVAVPLTAPALPSQERPGRSSSQHHGPALPLVQRVAGPAVVVAVVLQPHLADGQLVGVAYLLGLQPLTLYQLHCLLVPEDLGQQAHDAHDGEGQVTDGTYLGGRVGVDSADQGDTLSLPAVHPQTLNFNLRWV